MKSPPPPTAYRFGPFRIELAQRVLLRDGEPVPLTLKAYETLLLLIGHRDRIVEKDEILGAVWPDSFVSEDSLTQAISMLRKAMADDSSQPTYIATVPRRGYRFVADVQVVADPAPRPHADAGAGPTTDTIAEPVAIHGAVHGADALEPPVAPSAYGTRRWLVLALAAAAAVVALFLVARTVTVAERGTPTGAPIRFVQNMPPGYTLASGGVLSPDGRNLAFVVQSISTGIAHLALRALDTPTPRVIAATEDAQRPFWAPDSQSIGFFAEGKLKRVGVAGTPPQTLAPVGYRPAGGSWSSRGVIIYAERLSRLFAVPENGGTPSPITTLDPALKEFSHDTPSFLPDGVHFLFRAQSSESQHRATYAGSLDTPTRVRLLDGQAQQAIYAPPGYLLYVRDNVLFAERFDLEGLRTTGTPSVVSTADTQPQEDVARVGLISASTNGLLTFGGSPPENHLAWFARDGRALDAIPTPADLHNPVLSPDDRSLIAEGPGGVWLVDLERGAPTRLVPDGNLAAWTPDGARVAFSTRRSGPAAIHLRAVTGHEEESVLVSTNEMKIAGNWSPDGRQFVYASSNPDTRLDLWRLSMEDGAAPEIFLKSPANELHPQISPDGRWVAYASDESGAWEVYVQTFPAPGQKRTISVGGGAQPQWRRDGRELYYLSLDGMLMAVDVRSGDVLDAGKPMPLFRLPIQPDVVGFRNHYSVSRNGGRFVVDTSGERDPLNVVVNWNALVNP